MLHLISVLVMGKVLFLMKASVNLMKIEILQMCPSSVWKVKKVEKSNMIILTFNSSTVPSHVLLENVRVAVRAYKQKPVQCFKCYKFGHLSRTCTAEQICVNFFKFSRYLQKKVGMEVLKESLVGYASDVCGKYVLLY